MKGAVYENQSTIVKTVYFPSEGGIPVTKWIEM